MGASRIQAGKRSNQVPLLKHEPEIYPPDLFDPARGGGDPAIAGNGAGPAGEAHPPALGPWRVAHVRSRQEKRLARHLLQSEVPFYLPQRQHRFRAGDRWRVSHLPLFTGYVFFRGGPEARLRALQSNLVVQLLEVLAERELERQLRSLWILQCSGAPLIPHPYLGPGDEVEVIDGPLKGYQGRILREKNRLRLVVSITLLRQAVAAEVDRAALAPAKLRKVG